MSTTLIVLATRFGFLVVSKSRTEDEHFGLACPKRLFYERPKDTSERRLQHQEAAANIILIGERSDATNGECFSIL